MPTQPAIPEPLYIADKGDRLLNMLVEEAFTWLINEVEVEEAKKLEEDNVNNP